MNTLRNDIEKLMETESKTFNKLMVCAIVPFVLFVILIMCTVIIPIIPMSTVIETVIYILLIPMAGFMCMLVKTCDSMKRLALIIVDDNSRLKGK